jgi:RNA polymerase sigma factor (TIGR02999 family)
MLTRYTRVVAEDPVDLYGKVYGELRALAASYFKGRAQNTLQPTALVNEAFLRLAKHDGEIRDRAHFFAVAATAMRQTLIDRARSRKALKRGGPEKERVTLSGIPAPDGGIDLIVLDDLLTRLAALDERQARLVELRFFAGLTEEEAAETLGVSLRTVQKDWRKARAWLLAELEREPPQA